jgi:hypothetical protein
MKMKRHCNLCDHQKLSLKEGSLCGLSNKKPSFHRTCVKIDFDSNLLNLLADIFLDYEDLKLYKKKVYKNSLYGSIIGVLLLMSGYFVFIHFLNIGYRVTFNSLESLITVPFIIIVSGYYFITKSFNKFSNHKKDLNATEKKISETEEILNLYNQKYKYKVKFDKEIHGTQEIDVEIELT